MTQKFTLVELFVVMVVIVIMFTLLSPVFERIGAGNRVSSTAKSMGSELSLARQYAQTTRSYIALIAPGNKATYSGSGTSGCPTALPDKYRFSTYRLAQVDYDGTNYNFNSWTDGSTWVFLPKGCSIMEVDEDIGIYNDAGSPKDYVTIPAEPNVGSSGITVVQNVPFGLPLVEDTCNLEGDSVRAVVYASNGKLSPPGAFRNITIGEAEWNGTTFLIKNKVADGELSTNKSCANQINIKINGFTGAVSYLTPDAYE